MKNTAILFLLAILQWPFQEAKALVWWPEVQAVSSKLSVFQDHKNSKLFYYVPKAIQVAQNNRNGSLMISHALFFNRFDPKSAVTKYHLTFEAILDDDDVRQAQSYLEKRHGSRAKLVPLPLTTVGFSVTEKYGDYPGAAGLQLTTPFVVHLPEWTGDTHSFSQRFSAVMQGNLFQAEPAMSRFLTSPQGNAFLATMHFGFKAIQRPFKAKAVVNVSQFIRSIKTHLHASGFFCSVDIKTAMEKMKDDQSISISVEKEEGYESQIWEVLKDKLLNMVFKEAINAPTQLEGGSGSKAFSFKMEYAKAERDIIKTIDLDEKVIKDHSGDIDIAGGGASLDMLDPNIKYVCDSWAKYSRETGQCEDVCEPAIEYYNPKTKGCEAAFGSAFIEE